MQVFVIWNKDGIMIKCRCECKELIDSGMCDKRFVWNSSNCECECDKSCDVAEHLDYKNCKCRKRLIDKLVEECSKNIDGKNYIQMVMKKSVILVNSVPAHHTL